MEIIRYLEWRVRWTGRYKGRCCYKLLYKGVTKKKSDEYEQRRGKLPLDEDDDE